MALFTDDFTGSDGDQLVSRSGWTKFGSGSNGTLIINSNQLRTAGGDSPLVAQAHASADHFVEAELLDDLSGLTGNNQFELVVRGDGRNSTVYCTYNVGEGVWEFRGSGVGRFATAAATPQVGDLLRVEAEGSDYRLYVNDVLTMSASNGNAALLDNLQTGVIINWWTDPTPLNVLDNYRSGLMSDLGGGGGGISIPIVYHHRQRNF